MKSFKMNIFYTFAVYYDTLERWTWHFNHQEVLNFPVSLTQLESGLFWKNVVNAAVELEMLDFYGCLDSNR